MNQSIGDLYAEKAKALFREGYNCSQSVIAAFAEPLGLDFDVALKLGASFGGGMGRLRETCGAVSGMLMAAGLEKGYTSPKDDTAKQAHYELVQSLVGTFRKTYGTIQCRELLGGTVSDSPVPTPRTPDFYQTRPCEAIIGECARICAEALYGKQ